MKTQENVVSASTFPLCPPLCTPRPPFVNHFSPFRATFLNFSSAVRLTSAQQANFSEKSSGNPQVGYENAPIPIGAHRQPPRSRGFTSAISQSDLRVHWCGGHRPGFFSYLERNDSSCRHSADTTISHSLTDDQEGFDVSANWRPRSSSSRPPASTRCARCHRDRWC